MNFSKNYKGFSIIELLIVIFLFVILALVLVTFQKDIFLLNTFISGNLTAQDEARRMFREITSEVRSLSPSSIGTYPIAEASSTVFIFYSDINNDSLKERIRYFLDGTTLKKGVIKPSGSPLSYNHGNEMIKEIIYNVSNGENVPIFSYYDEDYDGTTSPLEQPVDISLIRLVKITVLINTNSFQPSNVITLTTQVSMRNLKDNL